MGMVCVTVGLFIHSDSRHHIAGFVLSLVLTLCSLDGSDRALLTLLERDLVCSPGVLRSGLELFKG